MLLSEAMHKAAKLLKNNHNIRDFNLESIILLSHVTGLSKEDIYIKSNEKYLNKNEYKIYFDLIDKRLQNIPISYLTKKKEFYGREFYVNSNVLIPRPDSEVLVSAVVEFAREYKDKYLKTNIEILELGVGSGCIFITLLKEIKNSLCCCVDISDEAIKVSELNAKNHNVEERSQFYKSNWYSDIKKKKYDILVSNPPYITKEQYHLVSQESILYEPKLALFSNNLEEYNEISKKANLYLNDGGSIFVETGFNNSKEISEIFSQNGFKLKSSYKDLSGYIRCLKFQI